MRRFLLCSFVLAALAACSTAVNLPYSPALPPILQATPFISSVTVTDARVEKDPNYIGAARGGFGNPLKTLTSKQPIAEEVRTAFIAALTSRNMFSAGAPDALAVSVTKLSINQLMRRDANAAFTITVTGPGGRVLYTDSADVRNETGIELAGGVLASTDVLHRAMLDTMTQAIDQLLDKPGFAALARPAP